MVTAQQVGAGILNAELQETVRQYREIKQRFEVMLQGLTLEQFNWRPSVDRWSVAQNIDHLNRESREQVPVVETLIDRGHREHYYAHGPFRHPWFGTWYISFLEPPYKLKIPTRPRFVPSSSLTFAEVVPEFMSWHDRLIDLAHEANGLDLSHLKAKLTYMKYGMPSLSLGHWLRLFPVHDRRHLWQIQQIVLGAEGFPR